MLPEKLEEKVSSKTKLLVLNSPANPTGRVYSADEFRAVAEFARRYDHVRPGLGGKTRYFAGVPGGKCAHVCHDGHLPRNRLHNGLDETTPFRRGLKRSLPGGAADKEAGAAPVNEKREELLQAFDLHFAVRVVRRKKSRDYALEFFQPFSPTALGAQSPAARQGHRTDSLMHSKMAYQDARLGCKEREPARRRKGGQKEPQGCPEPLCAPMSLRSLSARPGPSIPTEASCSSRLAYSTNLSGAPARRTWLAPIPSRASASSTPAPKPPASA